jgi:hypothetical protein
MPWARRRVQVLARGFPDDQIRIAVDCRDVTGRVRRELYTIAWPEPTLEAAPMSTDLFDGLP